MQRILVPLIFGLAGVAVLVWLGVWQMDRLAWKQGVLADIEARIAADPVALPDTPDPTQDRYLPVQVTGSLDAAAPLRVLVSQKQVGAGYRLISALETGQGRVLLDRGFIPVADDVPPVPGGPVTVIGNVHWPDDRNDSTPENDVSGNTWFARDIDQMAQVLNTRPLLVVARSLSPAEQGVTPLPLDSSGIPNDHLEYAITWFSLAAIWATMTGFFLWRNRRPTSQADS
ncbi:SURF1 family protein [Lutimaribacter sp. EGI FJ00015]|uniref:SURF1 family protein n=1 Tax=Lutimaribacter degradans TaxID=2945989 RepID=A0ACC5ZQN9_9RHOB|nr:SURF1 family protein [Lutimaribacter sp. EGI FJ00013]MCM2560632.1 SURF1 family protein [Lutimaribacter sp. EGI FJ00013]MCO0612425.1 SURF1 family protein [Lutimaribacter sp. EGI FJ00015]MCO0634456.1 SURF1 family protein [Lutimaribacter sp. EGI FJ00014]